jgi:hypothetical protein
MMHNSAQDRRIPRVGEADLFAETVVSQQAGVGTPLHDAPVIDHEQLVGLADGGEPMGDDE